MKQVLPLRLDQIHLCLLQTVATCDCYRLVDDPAERNHFKLYYPAKAIFIDCTIVSRPDGSEVTLCATSPICIISDRYEQQLLTLFVYQFQNVYQNHQADDKIITLDPTQRPWDREPQSPVLGISFANFA
jgi:hypothetical protein